MARKFKTPITIDELGSASSQALAANVDGDSQNRINIDAGGKITWGSGSATGDTTLYRSAVDTLKTDDAFTATSLAVTGQFTFPTSDGSADQVITTNGSGTLTWSDVSANATVSDTAPSSPATGQIWYESDTGKTFVYYDSYWIEVGASPPASPFITDLDEDTKIQVEESSDEDKIRFDTAGSERMIIDESGNVGIGTTSPAANLQVVSENRAFSVLDTGVTNNAEAGFTTLGGSDPAYGAISGYDVQIKTGTTRAGLATRLHVDNDGNVGIGTTSPSSILNLSSTNTTLSISDSDGTVGGSMNAMIQYKDSSGSVQGQIGYGTGVGFMIIDNNDGPMRVGTASADSLYLRTNNANRIAINSSGNVGIGDDTPSHKLEVNGEVRGNEIFVQKVSGTPSSAGWYTIAACPSGRASGLFNIHDPRSSYHESLVFYVSHMYGRTSINIISHNYFSNGGPITQVRHRYGGTYDGGVIQVYFQASSGGCEVFLSENYSQQTWTLKNFVADATDPGTHSGTWSSMTNYQTINMGTAPARGSSWATGAVNGSSKPFSIPHPTLGDDYTLRHCAIEGPENAVYHRGRCTDGTITMPEYWDGLVDLDTISVQLTPIGDHRNWVDSISGRTINVGGDGECFYVAYGERKDIPQIIVEEYNYPDPIEAEEGP